ncbi:hypothetical protein NQ318_021242 [Aromia moschata]|uniref:Uncharacterized protein n=1 Tax=Aromia moschata TaxID=1265417 RepID=A0AAV8X8D5_9CUCU|nr:hypothetical protein NQ318_021242 [Aromia moschata]
MRELHTQNPEKVNVWAGIIGENIIGRFFIDDNLNGETYLALLQNNAKRITLLATPLLAITKIKLALFITPTVLYSPEPNPNKFKRFWANPNKIDNN